MDVFGAALEARGFLCDAAIAAGHELGVFEALARGPATVEQLAGALGVAAGHRLRALLDALAAIGAVARERAGSAPRFSAVEPAPPRPVVPRAGWGRLAEVIRADRPLPDDGTDGEALRRLHHHLASAGAAAATELMALLEPCAAERAAEAAGPAVLDPGAGAGQREVASLLDLGAGAGAYSKAFLAGHPEGRATLVDRREVLALAADWLGPLADRARLVTGDAAELDGAELGGGHGAVLLANLLHLHGPEMCARLCAVAARAVAPGGVVVIKDLRVDDDRAGPLEGLLFALNMALYTDAGDVYSTSQLRAWLAAAGLVDVAEHRLAAAPDAIVVVGRRPRDAAAPDAEAIAAELDGIAAATTELAWGELAARGALRDDAAARPPVLAMPAALRRFLAAAVAVERAEATADSAGRAERMVRHYTDTMPRMRVAQLASSDEPGASLFHARLDWDRLPRLGAAIDRLFGVVTDAGVAASDALGAPTADAFRAAATTLAALYQRTHYGGFMPLLYGSPADLAHAYARGAADGCDAVAMIDRYLAAPIIHELCHFAPGRAAIGAPYLDECIAGWLGVHVHPALAYPAEDDEDALYAAPLLAQVGQAIARGFGIAAVVRAHAGDHAALPAAFLDAAARLGWDDWRARRTLHFLSDTLTPAPWVALALTAAAGRSPAGETLATLAATPLAGLALPEDAAFDRAIVEDGLRAMCLVSTQVAGTFCTRSRPPDGPITVDAAACAIVGPGRRELDPIVPRYWLPPAVAARLAARGIAGYRVQLATLSAIPDAAAAICEAALAVERAGFALSRQL